MKNLQDILYKVSLLNVSGTTDVNITEITADSRKVNASSLFVAIRGTAKDGHLFIPQVLEKGVGAIICEEIQPEWIGKTTIVQVASSRQALGLLAANLYDNPSEKLKLVGVTGTNGKTTTTTLLYQLFKSLGYKVGLLSTIRNLVDDKEFISTHTTPDPVSLNKLLAEMVQEGCTHAFMEVSSHAIDQDRIAGLKFTGAAFTNITHDHLDYHKTFLDYINAKKRLFDQLPADAFALINTDDKRGTVMVQNTKAKVYSFGLKSLGDFYLRILEHSFEGMILDVANVEVHTKMVGKFNAYNFLTVYAISQLLGIEKIEALTALSMLTGAEGRFDYVISAVSKVFGVVDYAHTPDALKNVLATINEIRTGNEKLITIVGCGGNRDTEKRPKMAFIASELSDTVILTSDNPRNEDPKEILAQMKVGVSMEQTRKVLVIEDRKEAIRTAVRMANAKDIILLAGKGHEKYQEIMGEKHPFDDKEILANTFKEMEK
ncbi:MAG: UDP-N-acetylmuramoyl-L-alanyl-D-glutamate--2,6-diaminopimelate ligase [Chitinophagales bacterium]|nr:UDP-N-acetylmuramoyl-L-alanyl-D-glutamate--2,6-diaminopimelate ligase [Chitinophagales bacterium]